jgi:cyclopropane fatty-acyl-phospholipid synthase-like methyltransferase
MTGSWDKTVFDRIYDRAEDPWRVQDSAYEIAKYDATLAALPAPRFRRALEIGCSIGVQTRRLAERCDRLLALDIAAEAVRRASLRCQDLAHVTIRQAQLPRDWPDGEFDLIVLSEILYFLDPHGVVTMAAKATASLPSAGAILLVNWTGQTDSPTTGDQAAELFREAAAPACRRTLHTRNPGYRIDVLIKD